MIVLVLGVISCSPHADMHLSFSDRIRSRVVPCVLACLRACPVVSAFEHTCDVFRRTFSPLSSSFMLKSSMLKSSAAVHLATSQTTNTFTKEPEPKMTQLLNSSGVCPLLTSWLNWLSRPAAASKYFGRPLLHGEYVCSASFGFLSKTRNGQGHANR